MRIFNPTDKEQKFLSGGIPTVFKPRESRDYPDDFAKWVLTRGNRNLVEHTPFHDKDVLVTDLDYTTMPWRKLVSLASARKLGSAGAGREVLVQRLIEYDNRTGRTIQEPSTQDQE